MIRDLWDWLIDVIEDYWKYILIGLGVLVLFLSLGFSCSCESENNKKFENWEFKQERGLNYFIQKVNDSTSEESKQPVIVAVIDSGIDTDHSWFENRLITDVAANCMNAFGKCKLGDYEDDHGHGTEVSGVVVKGTTDNVKILPIKVYDKNQDIYVVDWVAAIDYVVELKKQGLNIVAINFSMFWGALELGSFYSDFLKEAIDKAYDEGILLVACAGNDKTSTKNYGPANLENVITVSSVTHYGSSVTFSKSFSNYGESVDFAAPGEDIFTAKMGGKTTMSHGTSFATPYVSANIAMLYSLCSSLTRDEVEEILIKSADDYGEEGKDKYYGHGVINMVKAYEEVLLKCEPMN